MQDVKHINVVDPATESVYCHAAGDVVKFDGPYVANNCWFCPLWGGLNDGYSVVCIFDDEREAQPEVTYTKPTAAMRHAPQPEEDLSAISSVASLEAWKARLKVTPVQQDEPVVEEGVEETVVEDEAPVEEAPEVEEEVLTEEAPVEEADDELVNQEIEEPAVDEEEVPAEETDDDALVNQEIEEPTVDEDEEEAPVEETEESTEEAPTEEETEEEVSTDETSEESDGEKVAPSARNPVAGKEAGKRDIQSVINDLDSLGEEQPEPEPKKAKKAA